MRAHVWALLMLAASVAACGAGEPKDGQGVAGQISASPPSPGQPADIQFRSRPDPPSTGDNTFEVTVRTPDGSPIDDAVVTAVFSMPAMPTMNMPAMKSTVTLASTGSGTYQGTGRLSMGGTWQVAVTATRAGDELGRKEFSVVTK